MTTEMWHRLNSRLLFAFLTMLIVVPGGYALPPLLCLGAFLIAALTGALAAGWRTSRLDWEDGLWCLALLAFAASWLGDVARTLKWPESATGNGIGLPLWPVVGAAALIGLRCHAPSARHWWLGLSCGAVAAGSIALFERLVLAYSRASNDMNAIPFGNLALLLGFLSCLATLWWLYRLPRLQPSCRCRCLWLSAAGGMAGMMASLLSGTRGGWLAVPLLVSLLYMAWQQIPTRKERLRLVTRYMGAGALLLTIILLAIPETGVSQRLAGAVADAQEYWQGEDRDGSVGLRLEMWRGGLQLFVERPWTGWGEGRLETARDALVANHILHPGVSYYDQLHSDIIDTAARRGVVGLLGLVLLYGVPIYLFSRRLGCSSPGVRILAMSGLMITLAFLIFGLSQSMLRDVHGLSGYLGLSIGCWVILKREERRALCQASTGAGRRYAAEAFVGKPR
ncbi:O-antigen ligase [Onishia taeanensis]|uniref:O-antigen ligase n=1 Tax=Onishia taeanensis TaxID=284577 RepID=A0A1G7Q4P5_9GAMM|nr:O-antigen ligase family protein [Halomonas taeanensis]SDF93471.1 O-antigen ligase [Halomonas taeanensis]